MGIAVGIVAKSIWASQKARSDGRWFTAGAAARIRSHDASGAVGGPDESRFWRPGRIVRVDTSDALGDFLVIPRF